jgi:hypothetical protein
MPDPISRKIAAQRLLNNFAILQRSKALQKMRDNPEWLSIIEDDEGTVTRLLLGNQDWQEDRAADLIEEGHRNIETQRLNDPVFDQRMTQGDIDFVDAMSSFYPEDQREAPDPTAARLVDVGSSPLRVGGIYLPKAADRPQLIPEYSEAFDVAEPGAPTVYVEPAHRVKGRLAFDPEDWWSRAKLSRTFAHEFEHKRQDLMRNALGSELAIARSGLPNTGFVSSEQFTRLRDLLRSPTEEVLLVNLHANTGDNSPLKFKASEELDDVLYDIRQDLRRSWVPEDYDDFDAFLAQKKKETVSKIKLLLKALNLPTSKAGWKDKSTVHVSDFVLNLLDD